MKRATRLTNVPTDKSARPKETEEAEAPELVAEDPEEAVKEDASKETAIFEAKQDTKSAIAAKRKKMQPTDRRTTR
jgi:hypothetical protein